MTMPAVVLTAQGRIALQDRPRPTLRPDQVLVEVDLCGICGSDLHASQLPQVYRGDCILGHESTGRVAAVGDDVADWVTGQRVAVNPNGNVDGTCLYCRSGRPNFCRQATLETALGLQADGALAPLMAAFPGHLRRIPDERGTIYHMLKSTDPHFTKFGEIYFSSIYPGVVKGWPLTARMLSPAWIQTSFGKKASAWPARSALSAPAITRHSVA